MTKLKAVIIDDEALIRLSVAKIIEQSIPECEVVAMAGSAKEGIKLIKEHEPDIIITDINMADMDGPDMLTHIHCDSKVIVITGFRRFEYAYRAIAQDVYALILKPIHRDELINVIKSAAESIQNKKMLEVSEKSGETHYELLALKNILFNAIDDSDVSSVQYCVNKIIEIINTFENDMSFIKSYYKKLVMGLYQFRSKDYVNGSEANYDANLQQMIDDCESISELNEIVHMSINSRISPTAALNFANTSRHVRKAIKYIYDNYKNNISLEDVAKHVYLSTVHMSRLFKQETGKNLMDYLNMVRVEKAKELLNTHMYKIFEVSNMVGFNDHHYFSTMFKKYTNMTPSEYMSAN